MKVLACGLEVVTKRESIKATITEITIRFSKVQYEISYFYEGEYKQAWLDACEFDVHAPTYTTIGFRKQ